MALSYITYLLLKAIEVVEDTGDKAAAFHLARQLENAVRTAYWIHISTHKHTELTQHTYIHTQTHRAHTTYIHTQTHTQP